jgi:type I restriction enzyme M protein
MPKKAKGDAPPIPTLQRELVSFADILRSAAIDPADFKGYVFPLLFLKRICDTHAAELSAFGEDADFSFNIPAGHRWSDLMAVATDPTRADLGEHLAATFAAVEIENHELLEDIFGDVDWGNTKKLPVNVLREMISRLNGLALDPQSAGADELGDAYEALLKDFTEKSGKRAGEFYTPRPVVKLLTHLLDPQPGESVYDPTCGSGGMLLGLTEVIREKGRKPSELFVFGQELNPTTAGIARINLYIHGLLDGKIVQGDTLAEPKLLDPSSDTGLKQFDVVIANPPFSIGKKLVNGWSAYRQWPEDPYRRGIHGLPPKSMADWAFVEHMLASLKPDTGRLAVVLPHGALEREAEAHIRKSLVEHGLVMAVLGLAPNLFYNTPISVAVLILSRAKRPELVGQVLFVDASKRFVKGKNQNTMSDEDIDAIVAAYAKAADPDGAAGVRIQLVPTAEIETAGHTLSLKRYFPATEGGVVDPRFAYAAWTASGEELERAEAELRATLKEAGLAS